MKKIARLVNILVCIFVLGSCRDEIPLDTFEYENYLVVEATLTNELKQQEIKLSRTTQLDTAFANLEDNAEVYVMENESNRYDFEQLEDGFYHSEERFQARQGNNYQLYINTEAGRSYASTIMTPEPSPQINDLYARRVTNEDNIEGVQVYMDVEGGQESPFFNFEYEETYKIRSPFPSPVDFEILRYREDTLTGGIAYDVETMPNPRQETICYSSEKSTGINLGNSNSLDNNQLLRHPIVFLPANSPKIQERYSILAQAFSVGLASYTFYENLEELSTNDDLLSQKQPGFIAGNIISLDDDNEQVLGFFDVSLKTEQRIYFNYIDFDFDKPPYFYECALEVLDYNDNTVQDGDFNERLRIYEWLQFNNYNIYSRYKTRTDDIFTLISNICSDCTTFSSNKKPAFWED